MTRLSFMEHVSNERKKGAWQVGVTSRPRNMIPTKAKLEIYKSAILPHLIYCETVWHFCCSSDACKVERVQEQGLCAVYCSKCATNEELLKIAVILYKVKNNIAPSYIAELFNKNTSRYALRNADFIIPRFNTVTHGKRRVLCYRSHSLNLAINFHLFYL